MRFNKTLITIMFGACATFAPAFAQEEPVYSQEVSVQAFGTFVKSTTDNSVPQRATDSGGVLANYRYYFNPYNGIEADYGYSTNSQLYGGGGLANVGSYNHEFSASYVLRARPRRITPFALAGAAGLVFDPRSFSGATTQTRAAFVYGAGADLKLSKQFFLRAEYRGFVYDSPTFGNSALAGLDRITHRAEPSIGFGFRF